MTERRRARILAALYASAAAAGGTARLCDVAAEVTDMAGAGIMLMSGDFPRGTVCGSDAVSTEIEELQFTMGAGPCVDAFTAWAPVLVPDLDDSAVRWPTFASQAMTAGAAAVFAFPVGVGAVRLGTLDVYRATPGDLSDEQHANALVMANVAAGALLAGQADAPPGGLPRELTVAGDLHLVVHQASGMVSAQLGISVAVALVRLRAWAFAEDLPLADVARAVVDRRLRFDRADGEARWVR